MPFTSPILHSDSLAQAWLKRVHRSEHTIALRFEEQAWTYAQLHARTLNIARQFDQRQMHKGDRVLILMDNGPTFISTFFAAQITGLIPVPLSPRSSHQRIAYVMEDCNASLIAYDHNLSERIVEQHRAQSYGGCLLKMSETVEADFVERAIPLSPACAFIQYTSGSSGDAKGVMISHQAALNNIQSFTEAMGLQATDSFSSMLPLFHDMGLLCFGLAPLLLGHTLWLYRAESLQLYRWLEDLDKFQITHTGAPDSLLQIANRVVSETHRYSFEHLKMLICGSEPVRQDSIETFGRRFNASHALAPAYGMAELSLCASLTRFPCSPRINQLGQVASGQAIEGVEIAIHKEDGTPQDTGASGEIVVRSPAAMMGYWGKPDATKLTFTDAGFLKTGDLGFLDEEGYLYVIGRIKNLLIRSGEKYSAHDIESIAQSIHGVRRAAVVQSTDSTIYAVMEVDRRLLNEPSHLSAIEQALKRVSYQSHGIAPDICGFVASGALPSTENGKLKHASLRASIDAHNFDAIWSQQLKGLHNAIAMA